MDQAPALAAAPPSGLRKWTVAIRPFALSASITPVLFGTLAAVAFGGAAFSLSGFLLALLAMVLLHSGANMLSDVNDYRRGLDRVPTPVSGAVVRGWLTGGQVLGGAVALLATGSLLGCVLAARVGLPILWIGLAGVAIGAFYTAGPLELKYHGLGDLAVFLDFGILGALGAWTVQTGEPSWLPVAWAVPMSLLVIGILHANNWRDAITDTGCGIVTVASMLGDRGSLGYYGFLVFGPFALVLLGVLAGFARPALPFALPPPFLVTMLALPLALGCWRKALARRAPVRPLDFIALDGATAQLNLAFGLLCSASLLLHLLLVRS